MLFIIFWVVVGMALGAIIRHRMEGSGVLQYFGEPCNQRLELNWAGRQFFLLFSKGMSKRWYEARAHLYQNVFVSLLSTFHLIHIVRIDYETSRESSYSYTITITHGFQSIRTLMTKMPQLIKAKKAEAKDATYWYQTFVCGHNVVGDCINGDFILA